MPTRENSTLNANTASFSSEIPTSTPIYKNLLEFIQEASRTSNPGLQPILNRYADSMSAENFIDRLVNSSSHRERLLELASKLSLTGNPTFRKALYADEERIAGSIIAILNSEPGQAAVGKLEGDGAQHLLDIIQTILDKGFLITQEHSSKARKMMQKLSVLSNELPADLFVNVADREEHVTSGGTFSDIYRGHSSGKPVALKVIRTFHRGGALHAFRSKFYQHALIWQHLHHPNIVSFLGVDRESFSPSLVMVLPWMEHGSVVKYFGKHGRGRVNQVLLEIAQGLQYLHSHNIVHGDLRGANVLVNDEPRACLVDFGMSFLADASLECTPKRVGGLRWMAPELIDPVGFGCQYSSTTASDVYAFGCVIFELYTGEPPFISLSDVRAMFAVVGSKLPKRPTDTKPAIIDAVWELATRCWETKHAARPTIEEIVHDMSGIVDHRDEVELEKGSWEEPQRLGWPIPTLPSAPIEGRYPARTQTPPSSGCLCACARQEYPLAGLQYDTSRPISMQYTNGRGQRTQYSRWLLGAGAPEPAEAHQSSLPSQGFNQLNKEKDSLQGMNIASSLTASSASLVTARDRFNQSSSETDLNLQGEAVQNFGMVGVEIPPLPTPERSGVRMESQSASLVVPEISAGENPGEFTTGQIAHAETAEEGFHSGSGHPEKHVAESQEAAC